MTEPDRASEGLRLDRWLWQARFFKTRSLAATLAGRRKIRVNNTVISKAHYRVRPGDVLTFPQGKTVRIVRVIELGVRRGPVSEALTLYEDLTEQ